MIRFLRAHAGQTAAEYMGVLLVVSVIIAAVATTSVGTTIAREMERIVCEIFGGECGEPELSDCVTAEATDKIAINGEFDVRLLTVKLEGGVEYTRQKRANGQVAMSFKLGTTGGVAERIKKLIDVTVKGGPASSVTFVLPDDAAANRFAQQIKDSAKAIAMAPLPDFVYNAGEPHIDFPPIESVSYEQTGGVSVGADLESSGGYGNGSLEFGGALGIRRDLIKNETTAYYKVNGKGQGAAGMPLVGPGFTGALNGELTLAVTFDDDLNATKLSLQGVGGYEGGVEGRANPKDLQAALSYIDAIDLKANSRSGKKLEFQVDLDLTDANERALAMSLLRGVNPAGTVVDKAAAGRRLWDLFESQGEIQMRHYDTDSDHQSVGLDAVVAGGGIAHDTTSAELTSAEDYRPGQGFVPSVVCRR